MISKENDKPSYLGTCGPMIWFVKHCYYKGLQYAPSIPSQLKQQIVWKLVNDRKGVLALRPQPYYGPKGLV